MHLSILQLKKKITISVTLSKVYYSLYSSYNIFICNSKNEQVLVKRLLTRGSLVIVLSLKECKDSLHSQHASVFTKILPPFAFWTHFNALVFIFWGRYKNVGCEPTTETMATLNEEILKVLVIYKKFSSHAVGIVWATICYSHQTSFLILIQVKALIWICKTFVLQTLRHVICYSSKKM